MPDMDIDDTTAEQSAPPRELTKGQRRVLGVLLEKAFTTPEYYPLTLKALTAGCNQKSNRDPVTNYSEETVEQYLDELRELGLAAVVHTESGRTERFRHYVRKRYPFNEPQLAIITELLLRGRQQLGELRSRASRMVPIGSLETLRDELSALRQLGYVQASGPLERRGIDVDHALYTGGEAARPTEAPAGGRAAETDQTAAAVDRQTAVETAGQTDRIATLEATVAELVAVRTQLTDEVESLRQQVEQLSDELHDLRRALGS
jgi:uncharacterized protein YceH (UPF0502 family)